MPQRKGEPDRLRPRRGRARRHHRRDAWRKLRPIDEADGTVTAGNASQQNDAAAACLVVAEDKLDELGLEPMGYLVGWAAAGCEPSRMGIGPVPRRRTAASSAPASASTTSTSSSSTRPSPPQVLAVLKGWGWSDDVDDRLNVNGSGISLGHPIGATGVRILATLLHELQRRGGAYGLETMCIGGGQGIAAIFRGVDQ